MKANEANKARWEHCAINLGIYASFVLDTCERVTQNRVDGKTETEALDRLVTAAAVRDHWRAQADLLWDVLPELDDHLRQLAASALETYRLATGVLRENIRLSAANLKTSGIVH